MINEPSFLPSQAGWIEVICGGMFSGKTEELIRRARRAHIAGQNVVIVKPAVDNRYSETEVVSHNETSLPGITADTADQVILLTSSAKVVCIDEAQFFDKRIVDVANTLANDGKRVIIAGLDMDYLGKPFEPMPQLLAIAEYVTKLHAICSESGMMANFSQRIVQNEEQILVGEKDTYEPRARHCFRPPADIRRGKSIPPKNQTHPNPENQDTN
jgi:thymidine kinase